MFHSRDLLFKSVPLIQSPTLILSINSVFILVPCYLIFGSNSIVNRDTLSWCLFHSFNLLFIPRYNSIQSHDTLYSPLFHSFRLLIIRVCNSIINDDTLSWFLFHSFSLLLILGLWFNRPQWYFILVSVSFASHVTIPVSNSILRTDTYLHPCFIRLSCY